jgi:hypothetical protein
VNQTIKTALVSAAVALGVGASGATAASLITGSDVKNNSLSGADIANIRSGDIKNGTLLCRDMSAALQKAISACNGATAPSGVTVLAPKGDKGDAGSTGPSGTNGAAGSQGSTGATGSPGAPGTPAVTKVSTLSSNLDVSAPAWAKRENSCDPTGPVGSADIVGGHARLTLPVDGGNAAAGVVFNGFNGVALKDIEKVVYSERASGGIDGYNAPYFRIYLNDYNDAVIYSPSTQPGGPGSSEGFRRHVVTAGTVRYNDDAGFNPDITWDALVAAHGDDVVSQVRIVSGCSGAYSDGATADVDNVSFDVAGEHSSYDFG